MKHYKTRIIPEKEEKYLYKASCDLCEKDIKKVGCFDVDTVTISHEEGKCFPEGNHTTITSIDMCSTCFKDKFLSWLNDQEAHINTEDGGW